ncbi:MAG: chemotaxis protein CheA, partial [Kiritimatiellae bacterium]|nr:chemotaxis protein CheA [Kiritimatiellia bacterium]
LLQQIKVGKKKPEQRYIDVLLEGVDQLNQMLDEIEAANDMDISEIYGKLSVLVDEEGTPVGEPTPPPPQPEPESTPEPTPEPKEKKKSAGKTKQAEKKPVEEPPPPPPEPDIPELSITPDMIARFTQESMDLLDEAEQDLLQIDKHPEGAESYIGEAFRMMHSFKGNCGFFGLADFEQLSHKVETVLDAMRHGEADGSKNAIGLLLKMVDFLRNGLTNYAENGKSKILGLPGMLDLLNDMTPNETPEKSAEAPTSQPAPAEKEEELTFGEAEPPPTAAPEKAAELPPAPAPKEKSLPKAERTGAIKATPTATAAVRQGIRVDIDKLDSLINLVGELVIAEAMVVRNPAVMDMEDEMLERAIHHLNRVSADLQDVAMSVRMVPLSATFRKMTRLVYDVSKKAGKKVELQLDGEDTEVDKTVIEQIGDPLVHIVRNAIDHGLENPEERQAAGKPENGIVHIEARHEGGEVWIIIKDDGKGLNRERILKKAVTNGLVQEDQASDMKDEEVFKLVFEPGFSTAEKVTDISGRGVGMDVVKKNIEKLKGRVEVRSKPGAGTTFIMHIPLTLAIIDGMLIRVGDARYTIPLLSIRETLRPTRSQITLTPAGQEIVRVREEMIPVLRMHKIFNKKTDNTSLDQGLLIIVECDQDCVALFVDELLGQHQTVIKGLSDYLGSARGVSGCTILGDGQVSLILNVGGLIDISNDPPA